MISPRIAHGGGTNYTCIVFLRLSADFGVSQRNYFLLNPRHPSYQILATPLLVIIVAEIFSPMSFAVLMHYNRACVRVCVSRQIWVTSLYEKVWRHHLQFPRKNRLRLQTLSRTRSLQPWNHRHPAYVNPSMPTYRYSYEASCPRPG